MKIYEDMEMKEYSHMKIGGIAKELIFVEDKKELKDIIATRDKIFLLGNGTNTLISDGKLDISFVSLKNFKNIEIVERHEDYDLVRAEAGLDFDELIEFMEKNDYTGLENIAGVPGSVGGLVNMNGGAYGTEIFDCIEEVEVCKNDGEIKSLKKSELDFKYRNTEIKKNKWIVVSVLFKFEKGFDRECVIDKRTQRKNKHPLEYPNLGSTFKNPEGTFAAQLISDAGLKEYRVGNAMVSSKHPNFIINLGNAKFNDVISIIEHVKKVIYEKFNTKLETEIIILKTH